MQCARHPDVETGLACGRCGVPICPRCLMMTDVGARCQTCVPKRRPVLEEVGPPYFLRGLGASLVAGAVLGVIWGLILPPGTGGLGYISLGVAFIVGYLIAQGVSRAANRRSGPPLQAAAVVGVASAYVLRNLVGEQAVFVANDIAGHIAAVLAAVVAYFSVR